PLIAEEPTRDWIEPATGHRITLQFKIRGEGVGPNFSRRGRSKLLTQIQLLLRVMSPLLLPTPVPAIHHVVNLPATLRSEFSRHAPSLTPSRHLCQCLGLTRMALR